MCSVEPKPADDTVNASVPTDAVVPVTCEYHVSPASGHDNIGTIGAGDDLAFSICYYRRLFPQALAGMMPPAHRRWGQEDGHGQTDYKTG